MDRYDKKGVSLGVMQRQTECIEAEQATINQMLKRSEYQVTDVRTALDDALKLAEQPIETYLAAGKLGKRVLNQVFFLEIRVGEDGEIESATLAPTYSHLVAPRLKRRRNTEGLAPIWNGSRKRPNPDPLS